MYKNLISLGVMCFFIIIALGSGSTQKQPQVEEKKIAYEKTKNISLVKTNPQNLMITGNTLVINEIGYNIGLSVDANFSGNILVKNQDLSFDISLSQFSVESDYTGKYKYPVVFNYKITNNTSQPIKVIWDEVTYVDNDGVAHPVIKSGVLLVDKAKSTKDVIIPPQSKVDEIIYPSDYIYSAGGWTSRPVLENLGNGESVTIFLPVQIGEKTINYSFTFEAKENTTKSAPVTASVNGHCKLYNKKSDNNKYKGSCMIKRKMSDDSNVFVIELGNGETYGFTEQSNGYIVETPKGMSKNMATMTDHGNKSVFKWGKWKLTVKEN